MHLPTILTALAIGAMAAPTPMDTKQVNADMIDIASNTGEVARPADMDMNETTSEQSAKITRRGQKLSSREEQAKSQPAGNGQTDSGEQSSNSQGSGGDGITIPLLGDPTPITSLIPGLNNLPDLSRLPVVGSVLGGASAVSSTTDNKQTYAYPACTTKLACTFDQIQGLAPADKLNFLKTIQSSITKLFPSTSTAGGNGNQFNGVLGLLQGLQSRGLINPGSATSFSMAGVLEAIQRGAAVASGQSLVSGNNPGTQLFSQLLSEVQQGTLSSDRINHDRLWSVAEQASRNFGQNTASNRGVTATTSDKRFSGFMTIFDGIMQAEPLISNIFGLVGSTLSTLISKNFSPASFLSKTFDVTQSATFQCISSASVDTSGLENTSMSPLSVVTDATNLVKALPKILSCYVTAAGGKQ